MNLGRALLASWPAEIPSRPIGQFYGGGYYAGSIKIGASTYELIVAPKAAGEGSFKMTDTDMEFSGNTSINDGWATRANIITAGSYNFTAENIAMAQTINTYNDWYLASKEELEIIYRNLKPSTVNNVTTSGTNTSSIPTTSNYTTTNPAQTSVALFRSGGSEQLIEGVYFSATQGPSGLRYWHTKSFITGADSEDLGVNPHNLRLIRRILVP